MKTSLKKLRGLAHYHGLDSKDKRDLRPACHLDEIAQASKDMQDMRDCYNNLLSAAAVTENGAYEFSESLGEMGAGLLEKIALINDEGTGKCKRKGNVLLMLGKVQFELQKLIDNYRSHVVQTITIPSESLLNELQTVEDMKQQCAEKRNVYECMVTKQRDKGRSRHGKGEIISSEQLQAAYDEYEEEATLFIFRLKSLKQGQSHSLLTQAARHHAAQLCLFRNALKSLEAVEPLVKLVTEQQHVDYHFAGLEEDNGDDGRDVDDENNNEVDDVYGTRNAGELSFDYGQNNQGLGFSSTPRNLMEENSGKIQGDSFGTVVKLGSQSAPLFAEKKLDPPEIMGHRQSSPRRNPHAYVLPTPVDARNLAPASSATPKLWFSSPLEAKKLPGQDTNGAASSSQLPPPVIKGSSLSWLNRSSTYSRNNKLHAFSGPLMGSVGSTRQPDPFSGPVSQNQMPPQPSSTRAAFAASPRISELHELPRPPPNSANPARPSWSVDHSGSLLSSGNFHLDKASALPIPPPILPRSFSIPSSSLRMGNHGNLMKVEDVVSPHLSPISFPVHLPPSTASSGRKIRGAY